MSSSVQINYGGKRLLGSKWIGVYPLDKIPPILQNVIGGMIVNSQTSTLPGEHWIAVYFTNLEIRVFDPLGLLYPAFMVNTLLQMGNKKVTFNSKMYQNPLKSTCGQHCLLWLYFNKMTYDTL
jgi:hypothetical protein